MRNKFFGNSKLTNNRIETLASTIPNANTNKHGALANTLLLE